MQNRKPHDGGQAGAGGAQPDWDLIAAGITPQMFAEMERFGVMPNMIEAGVLEFVRFDHRFDTEEEVVLKIFAAMAVASGDGD